MERRNFLEKMALIPIIAYTGCSQDKTQIQEYRVAMKKDAFSTFNSICNDQDNNSYFPGSKLGLGEKIVIQLGPRDEKKYAEGDSLILAPRKRVNFEWNNIKRDVYFVKKSINLK
ncbi:MAG: hypothetical protein Q7S33_05230 [Nanoarchaeota archaeon]|nr:hypothetical protein [Nanoarchaeota archaeon]